MDIGSLLRVVLDAETDRLLLDSFNFKPGDRLHVRVVEVEEGQRALVDFGKFRAVAEVAFPVAAGDQLVVRVVDTAGQLHLALVRPAAETGGTPLWAAPLRVCDADLLKQVQLQLKPVLDAIAALPAGSRLAEELRSTLERLQSALEPLQPEAGAARNADRMRSLSENSGFFFEKRLEVELARVADEGQATEGRRVHDQDPISRILSEDLKPRLAAVKHLLEAFAAESPAAHTRENAALARSAGEMLDEITRQQENAGRRKDDSDPFQVIHFSLPLREGHRRGKLKIGYPKKGKPRTHLGFRASLLLDLDRLGRSRIDLVLANKDLSLAFFLESESAREAVEAGMSELKTALEPFFESLVFTVAVSENKITEFETEDLQPADRRRLDVRA